MGSRVLSARNTWPDTNHGTIAKLPTPRICGDLAPRGVERAGSIRPRVLFISSVATADGGSEKSLIELAGSLGKCGWEPALAVWSSGPLEMAFQRSGHETFVLGRPNPASPLGGATRRIPLIGPVVRTANRLRLASRPIGREVDWLVSAIDRWRPELIHTNCDLSLPAAAEAAARTGTPLVAHVRDMLRSWFHPRILRALREVEAVVVASEMMAEWLGRHGLSARVVPNPIGDGRLCRPLSSEERVSIRVSLGVADAFVIGVVGRLDAQKGIFDLVAAAKLLKGSWRRFVFLIAGRGDDRTESQLRRAVDEAGLSEHIRLLGYRDDVAEWLPALDALILPARGEAFGRVIVEGMLAGLPVVAYADGAAPELIENGRTGLLAAPGDTADLADAISRLMRQPDVGRALGRAARQSARSRFAPEVIGAEMAALYDAITGERRASPL